MTLDDRAQYTLEQLIPQLQSTRDQLAEALRRANIVLDHAIDQLKSVVQPVPARTSHRPKKPSRKPARGRIPDLAPDDQKRAALVIEHHLLKNPVGLSCKSLQPLLGLKESATRRFVQRATESLPFLDPPQLGGARQMRVNDAEAAKAWLERMGPKVFSAQTPPITSVDEPKSQAERQAEISANPSSAVPVPFLR